MGFHFLPVKIINSIIRGITCRLLYAGCQIRKTGETENSINRQPQLPQRRRRGEIGTKPGDKRATEKTQQQQQQKLLLRELNQLIA